MCQEVVNEASTENFQLLKLLVLELRQSNKLLKEKVIFLEERLDEKESEIVKLKVKSNIPKTPTNDVTIKIPAPNLKSPAPKQGINKENEETNAGNSTYAHVTTKNTTQSGNTEPVKNQQTKHAVKKSEASTSKTTNKENDGFIEVKRKKRFIYGNNENVTSNKLSGYIANSNIHVSRLDLSHTKEDVIGYIREKIPELREKNIDCTELEVKTKAYKSFKVSIPATQKKNVLSKEFWPNNVAVKLFWEHKNFRKEPINSNQT
ncbi:unnamed protein product [Brassicogethes aeneus]|uniref:Uncharacterized protein n=1 Tax=Brassicogethes aeneus TaxID=1431903 RepID=A0A9P0B4H4_BRAAE|nr:unnamed protein product [Brassicogethes aeneus]